MEIALCLHRFDPEHGGLEHWAFQYATWLSRQGNRVHIVAGESSLEMRKHSFVLHSLGMRKSRMDFAAEIERYVRTLPVDIVHDLGSGWYFDILQPQFGSRQADLRQNLLTLPLLSRWRRRWSRTYRRRWREIRDFEERQYRSPGGRIIAVSQMTRQHLEHFSHVPAARLSVVPNGVDTEKFTPAADERVRNRIRNERGLKEKIVLLSAAHNFRLKGVQTLLKALRRLPRQPLHALTVGRGEVEKYQLMAQRLGVGDRVTFCRFVEDIRDYYHAADIYVHPTFYDPCSLSVLEALACGLPVITSRCNGASELMETGREGIVLKNPASASELAEAIVRLIGPSTRSAMRVAARQAALYQTASLGFAQIVKAYGEILANGEGRDSHFWE